MLDHPCCGAAESAAQGFKMNVLVHYGEGPAALHPLGQSRDAQAAFFVFPDCVAMFNNPGIKKGFHNPCVPCGKEAFSVFFAGMGISCLAVDDKEAFGNADLWSSKPAAVGIVHGFPHVGNALVQMGKVFCNRIRFLVQDRLSVSEYWMYHVFCFRAKIRSEAGRNNEPMLSNLPANPAEPLGGNPYVRGDVLQWDSPDDFRLFIEKV